MTASAARHDLLTRLRAMLPQPAAVSTSRSFRIGLHVLDDLLPGDGMSRGAIHELISGEEDDPQNFCGGAMSLAAVMAQAAEKNRHGVIAWCDRSTQLYPPALRQMGFSLDRLLVLRVRGQRADGITQEMWAMNECLRCVGVEAVVAPMTIRLSQVQARRLQLSAERGGGIGILLRPIRALHQPYAAATRWMVRPARGTRTIQRWAVELLHGHGGRIGERVTLEVSRATNSVRASEALADRPGSTQIRVLSA